MPKPCRVPHNGQLLTLRELAAVTGLNPYTVFKRWAQGDRGEKLVRPPDPRGVRSPLARKGDQTCRINSLLAGWKLVDGASGRKTGDSQFASTRQETA